MQTHVVMSFRVSGPMMGVPAMPQSPEHNEGGLGAERLYPLAGSTGYSTSSILSRLKKLCGSALLSSFFQEQKRHYFVACGHLQPPFCFHLFILLLLPPGIHIQRSASRQRENISIATVRLFSEEGGFWVFLFDDGSLVGF